MAGNGVLFSGSLGGSNQGQAYSAPTLTAAQSLPFTIPPYFNFGEIYPTGVAPPPPTPPVVSASFSADFTTSTSLPTQMALSRASSATYFDSAGVMQTATSNVARFDYDPNSHEELGLLLEDSRTNYAYRSFTSWASSGGAATTLGTATTDLAGGSNAWPLVRAVGPGAGQLFINIALFSTASPVTMSCYVKPSGYNRIAIRESATTGASAIFILEQEGKVFRVNPLGTVTSVVAGIQNVGGGWYRIWTTMTSSSSIAWTMGLSVLNSAYSSGDPSSYSWTADGTSAIIASFPQIEIGAGATSYIAVPATTAITRSADIASSTDATWLGYKGWVIETGEMVADAAATLLGINTAIGLGYTSGSVLTTADGGTQNTTLTEYSPVRNRGGIGWDSTPRVSIALNGSAVTTAANTPATPTTLYFGNTNNGASGFLNGHIRKIGGYATLADADLPSVTVVGASFTGTTTGLTWNPLDKAADITLSNGNLTATNTANSFSSVRATTARSDVTGKWFFQIVASGTGNAPTIGFADSSFAVTGGNLGTGTDSISWWRDNHVQNNSTFNGNVTTSAGFASGDTYGAAWCPGNNTVEFYKLVSGAFSLISTQTINAAHSFTPSGSVYPTILEEGVSGFSSIGTANFGATAFAAALPVGVTSWDGSQVGAAAGAGSSTGSNTATAVGAWLQSGVGSSAGANTATAVGAELQSGVGSSTGSNTATAVGAWLQSGVGSSTGSNTATAVGAWLQSGVGSSAGANTSTTTGSWLQSGIGSSVGSNTATAIGRWLQSGVGSSVGTDTATGVGSSVGGGVTVSGVGSAVGSNIAAAVGAWLQSGAGTSVGGNVAAGIGPSSDFNNDFDQSFGGYPGAQTGFGPGDFNNDFNDDFAVYSAGRIVSGVAESVGGNIASAVGSWSVFIPPVYPPPPPIPVQVWHPAQEYHRVQPPKATRVYRRETELRRRPPQGMKRRYG